MGVGTVVKVAALAGLGLGGYFLWTRRADIGAAAGRAFTENVTRPFDDWISSLFPTNPTDRPNNDGSRDCGFFGLGCLFGRPDRPNEPPPTPPNTGGADRPPSTGRPDGGGGSPTQPHLPPPSHQPGETGGTQPPPDVQDRRMNPQQPNTARNMLPMTLAEYTFRRDRDGIPYDQKFYETARALRSQGWRPITAIRISGRASGTSSSSAISKGRSQARLRYTQFKSTYTGPAKFAAVLLSAGQGSRREAPYRYWIFIR